MSIWNNKTVPFWQETLNFPNCFSILISDGKDYRYGWPESFQPSMSDLINDLSKTYTSYVKFDIKGDRIFINLLSGKTIVSFTLNLEKNKLFLNGNKGLVFATNIKKIDFIKHGTRINHEGIFILAGREYNQKYTERDDSQLAENIQRLISTLDIQKVRLNKVNEIQNDEEELFDESESSKIEEILETLETYVNKEYEIEDAKARAEKPFVYTELKAEDIASTYKYYYRVTLIHEDIKRIRELSPTLLQIKKTDETFMDIEVFNIKPDNSPKDIIVTTSRQNDISTIDNANELYLVASSTLQKVRQRVIDDLRSNVSPNKWLIPLASGVYKFETTIKQNVPEYSEDRPLLPAQKEGVEKGAGSKDLTLVLGPPGTGKTTVILSWVKFFVNQGKKVLVTSQSNMAVDNVLKRLDEDKTFECLRVGNESKVMSDIHHLLIENYALGAQSKLLNNVSDVMKSLRDSFEYLRELNKTLEDQLEYNQNDLKYKTNIDLYMWNISEQHNKLEVIDLKIKTLNIDQDFLAELKNGLHYWGIIKNIRDKLEKFKIEFDISKQKHIQFKEELVKNETKLTGLKNKQEGLQVKIENYFTHTLIKKVFFYIFHKINILKHNSLMSEISSIRKNIVDIDQQSREQYRIINKLIELKAQNENELYEATATIPAFKYGITLENCEEKYEEFFHKRSLFNILGLIKQKKLDEKSIFITTQLEEINKDIELSTLSLKVENELFDVLNKEFKEINAQYDELVKRKPIFPQFVACPYVDDKIYISFFPDDGKCGELIAQTSIDINFYSSLIDVLSFWVKSMQNERQASLYETILDYVDVVGATCIGINSNKLFADIPFDVVIVDESGQIQLHNLMVPLSRASKAILVGDHKQLPPVVNDELAAELEEQGFDPIFLQKSWFEILWDKTPDDHKTMLDTQFRCPAIISDFVSKAFYQNKYFAGRGMELQQPILPYFNSTMTFIDTSKIFPSFEQSRIIDGRRECVGNEVETTIIIEMLKGFIKKLPYLASENQIGIIVPYKNHVLEVKKMIKKLKLDIGNLNVEDLVASVDSYQGQERDVIIFAFTRSNKEGNIGFLADWRRLNVAMTRTKKQLVMIGSLKTLTKDNHKEHEQEFKRVMRILEKELSEKKSIIDGRELIGGVNR
jgi:superfamily I DNA and/or RNA helicase